MGIPALCSILGPPRNPTQCRGEGASPAASGTQSLALHCPKAASLQRQLFLALACSPLLISCPCDPGNALLPQAATPRLESLFLALQEPSCLCHAVEVGATQSCHSEATGWPAQTSQPRLVTNLPHLFQSVLMAFGERRLTQSLPEINRLILGPPCPKKPLYLDSELGIKFFQKRCLARSLSAWQRRGSSHRKMGLTSGQLARVEF